MHVYNTEEINIYTDLYLSGPVAQPPHLLALQPAAQGQLTDTGCC